MARRKTRPNPSVKGAKCGKPHFAPYNVKKQFESMQSMPNGRGVVVLDEVCGKYFAQLASGIWRKRTPKAYEFIDQLPQRREV